MKFAIPLLSLLLTCACADMGEIPSLAPRPIEKLDKASPAPAVPTATVAADADLNAKIAALLAGARAGDTRFAREDGASAKAIIAGGRAAIGSDAWIAGQAAQSALEAARQESADALSALDQLLVEQTTSGGAGLAEIEVAQREAASIVARQSERLAALSR
jgi:hypothetical protein